MYPDSEAFGTLRYSTHDREPDTPLCGGTTQGLLQCTSALADHKCWRCSFLHNGFCVAECDWALYHVCILAYSDISAEYVLDLASRLLVTGADFLMLAPHDTFLNSTKPVRPRSMSVMASMSLSDQTTPYPFNPNQISC